MSIVSNIKTFLQDEEGASGIEYALIAGVVAVALTASSDTIRTSIRTILANISTKLTTAATSSGTN